MNRLQSCVAAALASAVVVATLTASQPVDPPQQAGAAAVSFLREGRCYRIAFTIDSASSYKVLEILDGGWIRAEVDAGSGQAQRQSFWANTAQMVTVRELRCSE